jgi:hypothetical protein
VTMPPHQISPPTRTQRRRYTGTPAEVIEKLRAEGHNTDWYKPTDRTVEAPKAEQCGYFTIYYLEAQTAYTINHDGSKYLQYRTLKQSAAPCWYCAGCKTRFATVDEALAHRAKSEAFK